jgi:hypothetical protein
VWQRKSPAKFVEGDTFKKDEGRPIIALVFCRIARFSLVKHTKTVKIYQITPISQMARRYAKMARRYI